MNRFLSCALWCLCFAVFDRDFGYSASGPVRIVVDLANQQAYLYKGDQVIISSPISTGRPGKATPTGHFYITDRRRHHYSYYGKFVSTKNGDVVIDDVNSRYTTWWPPGAYFKPDKIPYFMRFNEAVGFHAGDCPGYPASHGCVRLPPQKAAAFYKQSHYGVKVEVRVDGGVAAPSHFINQLLLPEGLTPRLILSEPVIENPITICWDSKQQLYVLEQREGEAIISKHTDSDEDGWLDVHSRFAGGYEQAHDMEALGQGIILLAGSSLWWLADYHNDGWTESKIRLIDDLPPSATQIRKIDATTIAIVGTDIRYQAKPNSGTPVKIKARSTKSDNPEPAQIVFHCDPKAGVVDRIGIDNQGQTLWLEEWAASTDDNFTPIAIEPGPNNQYNYLIDQYGPAGTGRIYQLQSAESPPSEPPPKSANQIDLSGLGGSVYRANCTSCHGDNGEGVKSKGKSLVGVDRFSSADTLRVFRPDWKLSHQTNPHTGFDRNDLWTAAVITYIRGAWGNHANPVDPEEITALKKLMEEK